MHFFQIDQKAVEINMKIFKSAQTQTCTYMCLYVKILSSCGVQNIPCMNTMTKHDQKSFSQNKRQRCDIEVLKNH